MGHLTRENGRQLYYEDHPAGGLPVLLIHSWAMNVRVWDSTLPVLARLGHRAIAFDQRGCGASDKDFADFSIEMAAADAVALADALALDRTIVFGWSLGGAVATAVADRLGPRCAGLILMGAASPRYCQAPDFPHGAAEADVLGLLPALARDRASFFHGIARAVCAKPVSDAILDWMWSIFMQTSPGVDQTLACLASVEQREIMARLEMPALLLAGTQDNFTPIGIAEAAAKLLRHATLVRFEGCGHAPFIEDYDRYVGALEDFLAALN